jgi:bifunctional non-homologous end joining protein LigD
MALQRKKPEKIGTKAPLPSFIERALASSIAKLPTADRWLHEIKFDGYRVQTHLKDADVKVFSQFGHGWTQRFRKDRKRCLAYGTLIDGEVVVPSVDGTTDFSILQNELRGRSTKIVLIAFDLLYLNGYDLRKVPLFERRRAFSN